MRKIISSVFISLDGVMQAAGGPEEDTTGGFTEGGWLPSFFDEAVGARIDALFDRDFDLLLGRKTYEIFAAHWPYVQDDPIGPLFDRVAKYVVTTSSEPLTWQNSHKVQGDIAGELKRMKQADGPDLLIQGSSMLYPLLFKEGLIDQLNILTFPVILGHGKRLFAEGIPSGAWKLVEQSASKSGVVMATYEPNGTIPPGNFQLAEPTDAEKARRAKMKQEG